MEADLTIRGVRIYLQTKNPNTSNRQTCVNPLDPCYRCSISRSRWTDRMY